VRRPPPFLRTSLTGAATTLYTQTLHKLVAQHYLSAALPASHQSPRDKLLAYDAEERAKLAGLATAKQLAEARMSAEERLRRDDRAAEKVGLVSAPGCVGMVVNYADEAARRSRRRSRSQGPSRIR
jgi:DNA-directed RNA polymerase III subunit RPC3